MIDEPSHMTRARRAFHLGVEIEHLEQLLGKRNKRSESDNYLVHSGTHLNLLFEVTGLGLPTARHLIESVI